MTYSADLKPFIYFKFRKKISRSACKYYFGIDNKDTAKGLIWTLFCTVGKKVPSVRDGLFLLYFDLTEHKVGVQPQFNNLAPSSIFGVRNKHYHRIWKLMIKYQKCPFLKKNKNGSSVKFLVN